MSTVIKVQLNGKICIN